MANGGSLKGFTLLSNKGWQVIVIILLHDHSYRCHHPDDHPDDHSYLCHHHHDHPDDHHWQALHSNPTPGGLGLAGAPPIHFTQVSKHHNDEDNDHNYDDKDDDNYDNDDDEYDDSYDKIGDKTMFIVISILGRLGSVHSRRWP